MSPKLALILLTIWYHY